MGKQAKRGGKGKFSNPDELEGGDEERPRETPAARGLGGQSANAGMMPPSDDDDDEEEEEELVPVKGGQNANAGMMPPDDDDEDEDEEDEDPNWTEANRLAEQLMKVFKKMDTEDRQEFLKDVLFDKFRKAHEKAAAAAKPKAPELTRKEREQLEAQKVPELSAEQDAVNKKKLEEIKKKREDAAKKRIADDGWDRYKPISETNKPPAGYKPPPEPA